MKAVLEAENSTLDLRWILNLVATLRKSATVNSSVLFCEQFCDTSLALWQDRYRQNSFAILAPAVARGLVAALASHAYVQRASSVCVDVCTQA